ncbi:unnamed protein product [Arabis nemorensis]|uniref:RRM domain-containing protein n=1 Tax=Arabis nemorensis TaxID=586526 RepID=A0A565CEH0_9BRAS|nr:unnamed protein product [Arabis nemorensis]
MSSFDLFSTKETREDLSDFDKAWSKSLRDRLPLLREQASSSAVAESTTVTLFVRHLTSYFDCLSYSANPNTILDLLFPPWRKSLEMPILFLGNIHPYLLTSLLRSLANTEVQDTESLGLFIDLEHSSPPAWSNKNDLMTRMEEIEHEMQRIVTSLLDRMMQAQKRYMEKRVASYSHRETILDHDLMNELANIFVEANGLRKTVLNEIVAATNARQKALFLEGLCELLSGFNDQNNQSAASPVMIQQPQPQPPRVPETYCIFVGDLSPDVTDQILLKVFAARYRSAKPARVIVDNDIGVNKGYGFVGFEDQRDQRLAMEQMNGQMCTTRPMRTGPARNSSV